MHLLVFSSIPFRLPLYLHIGIYKYCIILHIYRYIFVITNTSHSNLYSHKFCKFKKKYFLPNSLKKQRKVSLKRMIPMDLFRSEFNGK